MELLSLFFLPPYSPEMNRIEDTWLHLKRQELGGRVFEDEYDLALAIIEGIENRGQQGNYWQLLRALKIEVNKEIIGNY